MSGPVGIVDAIGETYQESRPDGWFYVAMNLLMMAILLSVNLGVMNLLPIPALDGGRAAEALIFGSITTGASNDIEQMTKLARGMITRYGMSDEFGMMALETVNNQYMGGDTSLACAAETAAVVDEKVKALLKKEYDKAMTLLTENKQQLHALAKYLYEKETITGDEFMQVLKENSGAN